MASLKKLVLTGTILSTIGLSGAYYLSNADVVQTRVNSLFNLADQYKNLAGQHEQTANEKQAILEGLASYLGISATDLESLKDAIDSKLSATTDETTQEILNTIASKLGLTGKENYTITDVSNKIAELNSNDKELKEVLTYLEIDNWDGTSEEIEQAIQEKVAQAEQARENALMNEIAWNYLGLAKTDADGKTINYTKAQVINEIVSVTDEIKAVEQYIDDYDAYNNSNMDKYFDYNEDGRITLLEKVQSMIDQLDQAREDSEENLALVEQKIVNLGHCPQCEGKLNSSNHCTKCNKTYTGTVSGGESSGEDDRNLTGGNSGTTTTTPSVPDPTPTTNPTMNTVAQILGTRIKDLNSDYDRGYEVAVDKTTLNGKSVYQVTITGASYLSGNDTVSNRIGYTVTNVLAKTEGLTYLGTGSGLGSYNGSISDSEVPTQSGQFSAKYKYQSSGNPNTVYLWFYDEITVDMINQYR